MALAIGSGSSAHILNFSLVQRSQALAAAARPANPDVWAFEGSRAKSWGRAARAIRGMDLSRSTDGKPVLALLLKVGSDRPRPVLTNATSVTDLLAALGLELTRTDLVKPASGKGLWPGMHLRVIRVTKQVETMDVTLPFETLIQYSNDLAIGETKVVQEGRAGIATRTWRVTYRNGVETGRVLLTEVIVSAPISQIVQKGTDIPVHGTQTGQASWYDFCRKDGNYAAHLTLPFGTVVTVLNLDNGKTVTVVINDRGPYGVPGRIIDLCDAAFAQIAPLGQGVANVQLTW
jgi:hypothetical protein